VAKQQHIADPWRVRAGERRLAGPTVRPAECQLADTRDRQRPEDTYAGCVQVPAFRSAGAWWGALPAAMLVLAVDQLSKSLVLAARPSPGAGLVSVRLVRNSGAAFGVGAGHPVVVMLVSAVVIAAVAVLMGRTPSRPAALLLAVVLGGALGNLADRLFRSPGLGRGAVIDWIHVQGYPATFNIADVAIRVGAAGAIIMLLRAWTHRGYRQRLQHGHPVRDK
jgi:signal peptidase II